ncbi:MAG: hypothetical protein IPM79_34495 [Polyangiaceae bacterium]|jgi:hypothetical protein|nr:hypothetical protein [Polyangiaceae bacterium]
MRNAHRHWIAGALAAAAIATGTTHAAADEPRRGPGLDEALDEEALDDEALDDEALDDDEPCAKDELLGRRRQALAPSPEHGDKPRVRSWGMVGAGTATALIGLLPTFFGISLIAEDQAQEGDLLDGLGTTAGGILAAVGVAHLAIGIPLIAVGAQSTAGEQGAPAGPRVDVRAGLGSAELFVTF